MGQYTSYYLYQKFEKRDGQDFIPVYPNTYSTDANGTMPKVIKEQNDENCGYMPPIEPVYRWHVDGYVCDTCPDIFRWSQSTIDDYMCNSKSKFYKEYYQVSHDEGVTWENVQGVEPRQGGLIEGYSTDCGYDITYKSNYLTFKAVTNCTFSFNGWILDYSLDNGTTWNETSPGTPISVSAGNKILWKSLMTLAMGSIGTFSATGTFEVEGNINSLQLDDKFLSNDDIAYPRLFEELFKGCSGLTKADNLVLPANRLSMDCYNSMFEDCVSLTHAPALPALYLASNCYTSMFKGCTSLTAAPVLPATTLAYACYGWMFQNCTSLVVPPVLPAITLADYCYSYMFYGCTSLATAPKLYAPVLENSSYYCMFLDCPSLNNVECLASVISASDCLYYWLSNVSSTGTFIKNTWTTYQTGPSGIPSGWLIQNV